MDILIKGMDMPKHDRHIIITSKGEIFDTDYRLISMRTDSTAIELPPHGELVQRSDILRLFDENKLSAREAVMKAPTILEATE